jgi:hypothetical protein
MFAGAICPRPALQQSPYREQKQNELQQGSPWIILVRALHISLDDSRPGELVESGLRCGEGVFKKGEDGGKGSGGGVHFSPYSSAHDGERRSR